MWAIFSVPAGRVCKHAGCSLEGQVIDRLHERICGACDQELVLVSKLDRKAVVLSALGALILLVLLGSGIQTLRVRRAAAREAEILAKAQEQFERDLVGARASQVAAILEAVKKELTLSEGQCDRLLKAVAPRIAQLPRDLGAELQPELEKLVRAAHGDGVVSVEEQKRIDAFIAGERVARDSAQAFVGELEKRLENAGRSLTQGRLYAADNQPQEALKEFASATEIDPGNSMAWANLGAAKALLGENEEAINCYERALELDAGNWLAHFNWALASARSGNRRTAFEHISAALGALPQDAGRERRALMRDLQENPAFSDLRGDPRFGEIVDGPTEPLAGK